MSIIRKSVGKKRSSFSLKDMVLNELRIKTQYYISIPVRQLKPDGKGYIASINKFTCSRHYPLPSHLCDGYENHLIGWALAHIILGLKPNNSMSIKSVG